MKVNFIHCGLCVASIETDIIPENGDQVIIGNRIYKVCFKTYQIEDQSTGHYYDYCDIELSQISSAF